MDSRRHRTQHRHCTHQGSSRGYQPAPLVTYGSPQRSSASQQNGTGHSSQHRNSQSNDSMYTSSSQRHESYRRDAEYHYWHEVPRPWETENPQVRRSIAGERQHSDTITSPQDRGYIPPQPFQNSPYETSSRGTRDSQLSRNHASVRLTLSDLQRLGHERTPTTNMALWREESQRVSPWNGVGYVRVERDERRRNGPP